MANTKVIATTWSKKDLVKKLNETLKRMDAEIDEWNKESKTLDKRQQAWDKKAEAWLKKNIAKAKDIDVNRYHNRVSLNFTFDDDLVATELGERPTQERMPKHKDTNYNQCVSDYDQVQNAIALIEGSTDTEFKINTSSVWASFIR